MKMFEGAVFARIVIWGIATVANRLSEVLKTPRKNSEVLREVSDVLK
jgi:hypothetical protein